MRRKHDLQLWLLPSDHHNPRIEFDPLRLVRAEPGNQLHNLAVFFGNVQVEDGFVMKQTVAEISHGIATSI